MRNYERRRLQLASEALVHDLLSESWMQPLITPSLDGLSATADPKFTFGDRSDLTWVDYRMAVADRIYQLLEAVEKPTEISA